MRCVPPIVIAAVLTLAACGSSDSLEGGDPVSSTSGSTPLTLPAVPASDQPPTTAANPQEPTAAPGTTEPPSTEPTATVPVVDLGLLIGRTWVVESFITVGPVDEVPDGIVASLTFGESGGVAVETGCNSGSGHVAFASDGTFTVTELVTTEIACEGDAAAIETRVLAQLGHALFWSVDGDQLTVYPSDVSDTGMRLRAVR